MAEAEERQNMETVASDNGLNEANIGIHCDDDVVIEPTKAESVENLVDSLNLESCCIDSNTNETESDSEFDSDESEVTDEEESDEELSEGDGEAFVRLEPWTCERRHSGDGEEQPEKTTESKLDDDEDKQNPAYIPRKGSFFEHDLRLDDDGVEVETDAKLIKKKLWYDRVKWQHDKFDERSQAPKSRDEIVQIYGFDIREENRVPLDATRRSVKKRTNKKGRGKRLGDYIVFAKPVPVSLERVKRPVEGMRQFCPRRSWPENNLRRKNVIMKSLSPETVSRSKYVGEDKKENFAGSNDPPATQRTTAGYDEIPPCFVQKVEAASAERSVHNDSRRFPENRNPTKFEPADGKLVFRSIRGNKTGRIGTGRIIGKGGPREFQPERYNPRHDKQALENPNRPAKKHFSTKRTSGMDRGAGLHTMRTIRNSGTCGHTETIETFKDAVADNDGQSTQRIMSSALTKSQDVRLLETQDGQHPTVSRISGGSGHDAARNEKSNRGYSKASGRKSTTTIHTTMAPEMIPPVTRIPTYTRSVETRSVRGRPVAHEASLSSDTPSESVSSGTETTPSFGWTGGEFIPSEQLLPRSDASGRPKRYSSQRQKVGTESGLPESANLNDGGTLASVVTMPGTAGFTTSLPQRPLPAATYYGSAPGAHGVPVFPHPSVLPLGMSSIAYTVPVSTNVAPGHIRLYNGPAIRGNPVAMATTAAPPLMHAPYLNPPGMLQGPYIGPPPVINYGPPLAHQYPVSTGSIPVQFTAGTPRPVKNQRPDGNPLEVRGGTVYFNPEIQQADMLHGMVYFNAERQAGNVRSPVRRAKVAIPIVKPEDVSAIEVIECAEPGEAAIQQKEVKEGVEQGRVEEKQVVEEVLQEEEEEVPQEEFRQQERYECPESKDEDKDNSCLSVECSHLPAGDENSVTEPGAEEEEEKVPENSTGDGKENEFSKENGNENTSE